MKPRFSLTAIRELSHIIDYLDERNPAGERKVRSAILTAIDTLDRSPRKGRNISGDVRRLVVTIYPYLIYYRLNERTDEVVVLRIRHAARKRLYRDACLTDRLSAIHADITTLAVDAIVNAANAELFPGGGVDGAIRFAAGREMDAALFKIGGCQPGTSVITSGFNLPAKWAIHTVAPIYSGAPEQHAVFTSCYASALALADEHDAATVAFPCIGTGIYGWPADLAARLALETVTAHLHTSKKPTMVTFCCFSESDRALYADLISRQTS